MRSFIEAWSRNDLAEIEPARRIEATRATIAGFSSMATRVEWRLHQIAESESGVVLTERTDRFEIGGRWSCP